MKKRILNNKKGQFYIIAAIILIIIIIGMAGVSNYVIIKDEPTGFYDIGETLGVEGAWVIDWGIYNNRADLNEKLNEFTRQYAEYLASTGEEFELIIAYGDSSTGEVKKYVRKVSGEDCLDQYCIPNYNVIEEKVGDLTNIDTLVTEDNIEYPIEVKGNENFLFVITTSKGFEKYVNKKTE